MTPKFNATVEKNRLVLENPQSFSMWLTNLVGKKVEVIVKKKKKKRSTGLPDELGNQNGYYWAVVLPISAKGLGYTIDEMHEIFIELYAPYTVKKFKDKFVNVKIRTSEMDTLQFKEFLETIQISMAEQNIIIPDPVKIEI